MMLDEFCHKLLLSGYAHRGGGIFSKKINPKLLYWISVDKASSKNAVLVGCIFPELTKVIYKISEMTSVPAKPSFPLSWGPPIYSKEFSISRDATDDYSKSINEIEGYLSASNDLNDIVTGLLEGKLFSWNAPQVIAAGLALLGRCEELLNFKAGIEDNGVIGEFVDAAISMCKAR